MLSFSTSIIPAYASYEKPGCAPKEPYDPNYYGDDIVKNDPVVQLFLEKNPNISLSDAYRWSNSVGAMPYFWQIQESDNSFLELYLNLDRCYDIARYRYSDNLISMPSVMGLYQNNVNVIEAITGEEIPCENPKAGYPDSYAGLEQLEDDLLFRGFMKTNPDLYEDIYLTVNHKFSDITYNEDIDLWAPYMWEMGDSGFYRGDHYPYLRIEMDKCFNVAYFGYINYEEDNLDDPTVLQGTYDDNYHTVLTAITGKPFTPYVQVTFYEMPLREVQCNNDGNKLYIKDNESPMCLKPQTYENLLQRGYNLEKVQ